jgi:hypothetical protein
MAGRKNSDLSFHYTGNTLTIRRQGVRRYDVSLWPRPVAYRYRNGTEQERFYPEFRVVGYPYRPRKPKADPQLTLLDVEPVREGGMTKQEAYEGLRSSLPFSYAIALAPFKSHQWNVITLLSMHRRFYDLLKSNAVLAYLLANKTEVRQRIFRKELMMETLTGMPQAELLKLLELPDTKSVVKLLRKVSARSVFPGMSWHLSYCAEHDELLKPLNHLKQINQGALLLVSELGADIGLLEPALLEEVSEDVRHQHCDHAVRLFLQVKRLHAEQHPTQAFPRIRTIEALTSLRDELRDEAVRRAPVVRRPSRVRKKFEPQDPPILGTLHIQPLVTEEDLIQEGRDQQHCAGLVYPDLYMTGNYYAYRVLHPERATVSILKCFSGWKVYELYGAKNSAVQPATRQMVTAWLEAAQPGI